MPQTTNNSTEVTKKKLQTENAQLKKRIYELEFKIEYLENELKQIKLFVGGI